MIKKYINLTNGIEAIPQLDGEYSFIRIQSTACEQHLWDHLIMELDYDFLMNIAIGNECIIYDYGTRKPIPRAMYQGVTFIKYVLQKYWYGQADTPYIRKKQMCLDVNDYFEECYKTLSECVKKKLNYFKPYLNGGVNIQTITFPTKHDGDKNYYAKILATH